MNSDLRDLIKGMPIKVLSKDDVEIDGSLWTRANVRYSCNAMGIDEGSIAEALGWRLILQMMDEFEEPENTGKDAIAELARQEMTYVHYRSEERQAAYRSAPPQCEKHNRQMVLSVYDRPGSPPGNGWSCPECAKELESKAAEATPESENDIFVPMQPKSEREVTMRVPRHDPLDVLTSEVESLTSERDQFQKPYEDAFKRIESLTAERDELKKRVQELEQSWRCFRCGEIFTDRDKAAEHFSGDFCEDEEPWCQFVKRMEAAEKRVEELERQIASYEKELADARDFAKDKSVQLQAARKLAKKVERAINDCDEHSLEFMAGPAELLMIQLLAREFLKMLEETHAA